MLNQGAIHSFKVARIASSEELQRSLGIDIDIEASYGCAAFGAGASARFGFAENQKIHSETLFMTVTATVQQADQSIDNPVLTDSAKQAKADGGARAFAEIYGDMFARACTSGGIFVGDLRVDTCSQETARIEGELSGSHGAISGDAKHNFQVAVKTANASAYFEIYSEGGPKIAIGDPTDPSEMLNHANAWMAAMCDDPVKYSRPYEWPSRR